MKATTVSQRAMRVLLSAAILFFVLLAVYPFYWLISTSLKTLSEALKWPPSLFPDAPSLDSYRQALATDGFMRSIWNSVVYSVLGTFLTLLMCTMAAFGFSRYKFRFKGGLFFIIIATLMIPGQITMIPVFLTLNALGWINTFKAMIIPGIGNAFGIFLVNQFAVDVPEEYFDSGRIDGASEWMLYYRIFIPLCKPVVATLIVLEFIGRWNDLFWPLIVTNKMNMAPLTLFLTTVSRGIYDTQWNDLSASMVIAIVPILALYIAFQKYFIEGISLSSGIKG